MEEKSPLPEEFPNEGEELVDVEEDSDEEKLKFVKLKIHTELDDENEIHITETSVNASS